MRDDPLPRIGTGIDGLDTILNGGIPEENLTLISGPPGAGKSTLGAQFLMDGAQDGRSGVYISIGEDRERVIRTLESFNWDAQRHIEEDNLRIISPEMYNYKQLVYDIKDAVEDIEAQRIFVDSLTILKSFFEDDFTVRQKIIELRELLDGFEATTLATAECRHVDHKASIGVEEYIVDGVIHMFQEHEDDQYQRYLVVKKMLGTRHDMDIHHLHIDADGIELRDQNREPV